MKKAGLFQFEGGQIGNRLLLAAASTAQSMAAVSSARASAVARSAGVFGWLILII